MKLFKTCNINLVQYCEECFSFDMPSDLWRKRVTNFESKFTDFYMKVQLNLFLFLFACFAVYYACCYSCYCYHDLVKQRYICNEFQPYVQVRDNFCHVSLSYFVILSLFCVISCDKIKILIS